MAKQNISDKAKNYLKENEALLKKYKLLTRPVINFAQRKRTPLLSRIALRIIQKQGGTLDMQFIDR